jgi:abhydrolase domain-containing protein 6
MKKILKFLGIGILSLIVIGAIIFFFFPGKLILLTNWNYANEANLDKRAIDIANYKVHYYQSSEMNKKETLVLLHGLGDDKSSFLHLECWQVASSNFCK